MGAAAGSFSCCASSGTFASRKCWGSVMLARGNWRSFSTTDQPAEAVLPAASSATTRIGGAGGASVATAKMAIRCVRIAGARTRHAAVEALADLYAVARRGLGHRIGDRARAAAFDVGQPAGDRHARGREIDRHRHLEPRLVAAEAAAPRPVARGDAQEGVALGRAERLRIDAHRQGAVRAGIPAAQPAAGEALERDLAIAAGVREHGGDLPHPRARVRGRDLDVAPGCVRDERGRRDQHRRRALGPEEGEPRQGQRREYEQDAQPAACAHAHPLPERAQSSVRIDGASRGRDARRPRGDDRG